MAHKKSKFWNFCISCMPGAGQMYQGFLKRGVSLMILFFADIFIASVINMDVILFGVPVIWFYSFFDSLNRNSLSDEEFASLKDDYLFVDGTIDFKLSKSKFRIPAAILLILFGAYILAENIMYMLFNAFEVDVHFWIIERVMDYIPRFVFSGAVILAGIYLIKGKRDEVEADSGYSDDIE